MKKLIILSLIAILIFASCSTVSPSKEAGLVSSLAEKEYEILGTITKDYTVRSLMGIITWGGGGYADLLEEAKELYPEMDEIINIRKDSKTTAILGIYNRFTKTFSATVIKFVD